ncbi:MAG: site-specific recombinase [Acidobacteriota bacterium]|nr:site-specific recombinase [Acidobacteriota bacterium]
MNFTSRSSKQAATSQMRECILVGRVSSRKQDEEGFSIPSQQKLLRGYTDPRGLKVVSEFFYVESSKRGGNKGITEITKFLTTHPSVSTLVVEKTDRLYRNLKDYVTLDEMNLEIHFVKENFILSKDSKSSEKFMHGIKVLMAKNYIDNLSEETKKGLLEKAEENIYPSYAPLGYTNVEAEGGKKNIAPDLDRAQVIILMFEWGATGKYSLKEITKKAYGEGLRSRNGNPVSKSNVHKILRKRTYTGDFDWNGKTYRGTHQPLISRELFERVQTVLDGRFEGRHRKFKHDFAFSRLIECGHCGCSLVGEIKKGRYIYYHCTGYKGKCPEPYTREEVLEEKFGQLLEDLVFDEEVIAWITEALRQSHADEKRYRNEAVAKLQKEYDQLVERMDKAYEDKLDGVIGPAHYERLTQKWNAEQRRLLAAIEHHQQANQSYLGHGVKILELAQHAHSLYLTRTAREKRQLLDFVLSNSTWKHSELTAEFRQPFDMLAVTNTTWKAEKAAGVSPNGLSEIWLRR